MAMVTTMMMVFMGLMVLGAIAAGLVFLHHGLKNKERAMTMEKIKTEVIPELEAMTNRMLENSMDMVIDKSVEISKKMTESMYN